MKLKKGKDIQEAKTYYDKIQLEKKGYKEYIPKKRVANGNN